MEIVQSVISVATTGGAGAATGSASSGVMHGYLLDIFFDFNAAAPATTDTTVAYDEPDNGTILTLSNTATDALHAVRKQISDPAGAAVAGAFDQLPLNGRITVSVAGSDALDPAVTARVRWLRV